MSDDNDPYPTTQMLDDILSQSFSLLEDAVKNRKTPMHTPVVASNGSNGAPNQRVMVLREFDVQHKILRFHTDIRSPKISEIKANNAMSILAYDPQKRIQLKLYGYGEILSTGDKYNEAWSQTDTMGRRCYLCEPGSGAMLSSPTSGLSEDIQSRRPTLEESEAGQENFAILLINIHRIDWLYLNSKGNRAARFIDEQGEWNGQWIVP